MARVMPKRLKPSIQTPPSFEIFCNFCGEKMVSRTANTFTCPVCNAVLLRGHK